MGDQRNLNSCVTWTIGYAMMGWYANYQHMPAPSFAPMYMYSQINLGVKHDYNARPPDGFNLARDQGVDISSDYTQNFISNYLWPYNAYYNKDDQPTTAQRTNAAKYRIGAWHNLFMTPNGMTAIGRGTDAINLIKSALANSQPVAIMLQVRDPNFSYLTAKNDLYTTLTGNSIGNHEMLAIGYDQNGLLVQNSWGPDWGKGGFGRLSWAVVQQDVLEADVIDQAFSGTPLAPMTPQALSGLWYDPAYAGSGFYMIMTTVGWIGAYFGWDNSGNRLWLYTDTLHSTRLARGTSLTLNLYQTVGGQFKTPARPETLTPWGTVTLNFSAADGSAATATIGKYDYPFANLHLSKLAGVASPQSVTGFWYDPLYTGSGFSVLTAPVGTILYYYGWDKSGRRLWLQSDLITTPLKLGTGTSYALNMNQTNNGSFLSPANPSTLSNWGVLNIKFSSCAQGAATLSGIDGTVNLNLSNLVSVLNIPCQ